MPLFDHVPHPHIAARAEAGPVLTGAGVRRRLNDRLAVAITRSVGTMACAYVFTALALVSLPASLKTGDPVVIVAWIAQTFLQLVLLSIILLGGNISAETADRRAEQTYLDAEAVLHTAIAIQEHLAVQDDVLTRALDELSQHTDSLSGLHTRLDSLARKPRVVPVPSARKNED